MNEIVICRACETKVTNRHILQWQVVTLLPGDRSIFVSNLEREKCRITKFVTSMVTKRFPFCSHKNETFQHFRLDITVPGNHSVSQRIRPQSREAFSVKKARSRRSTFQQSPQKTRLSRSHCCTTVRTRV